MKKFIKFICVTLALVSAVSLVACSGENNGDSQENLVINTSAVELNEGATYQIQSAVQGDCEITYQSSDETVAAVSVSGEITAIKQGECFIIVKAGQSERSCKVTVIKQTYAVEIFFENQNVNKINITDGTTIEIYANVYENGEEIADEVEWQTTGNVCDAVKTANVIRITAKELGEYIVTAKYKTATKSVAINVVAL